MKTSFVLQSRYEPMVAKLSDKQAGVLFKAIFRYVAAHEKPESLNDSAVVMAFDFICQDLDYNAARYAEVCQKRKEAINKRWHGIEKNTNLYNSLHNEVDNEVDVEVEVENENINTFTAQPRAAQGVSTFLTNPKTPLQRFALRVLEHFEPHVKTMDQKIVWFKRHCRELRDILRFCGENITLALQTIDVCLTQMEKSGLSCGYAGVLRNIPEYYAKAQEQLPGSPYAR